MPPRRVLPLVLLGALAAPGFGAEDDTVYELAEVDGVRVGSVVRSAERVAAGWKTTATLDLTVRRYGSLVRLRREESSTEDERGRVVAVSLLQGVPGGKMLAIRGAVEDGRMLAQVDDRPRRQLRWDAAAVGLRGQDRMWAEKKPRPGAALTFRRWEPTYNTLLTVRAAVKEKETVDLLGKKRSLLRVELTPDRLEAPGVRITPPRTVLWLDDDFTPVRRRTELDGLGTLVLTRTTRDRLPRPGAATLDVGSRSLVPLDRAVVRPYDTRKVTYRLTFTGGDRPESPFVHDAHQSVSAAKGGALLLTVHPVRPGPRDADGERPAEEYLEPNHFIDSGDERVVELARRAVAGERDPWRKALRIERWVKNYLRNDNAAPLVPAGEVARRGRGDCRHHAFLTAAMCRAVGVPSRTAIGLLYVYRGGPKLGFHTWVEVYAGGAWVGVDSTLGKGGVSAAHLKVTQHSWHGTESMTPLLPVNRVVGRLRGEVVRAE